MKLKIYKTHSIEFVESDSVHVYEDEIEYCYYNAAVSIREKKIDIERLLIDEEEIYNKSTGFDLLHGEEKENEIKEN